MSYESSLKRLPNFLRYVNKVYRFSQTIDSMQSKVAPETSPQTIFMSVFLCLLLRFGSFRQLAKDAKAGRIRKFIPRVDKETYCANTVANGLENIDTAILQQELSVVPKKLRRNKAYGSAEHPRTIGGFRIVAVDGTEHFRSECIHCPDCMAVHVKVKDGINIHYVHRIVIMYVVGRLHSSAVQVILGGEPAFPKDARAQAKGKESPGHEGESTAAKRLIEKMIALYGIGFFHIITADSYYSNKPFVLFLDSLGKYLVSRVKREDTTLYQEIDVLSQRVDPIYVDDTQQRVESWIYEVPELQTSLNWDVPTRGLKILEKTYKIVSGEKAYIKEETFLCNAIKDLKDNWHMEHNFHHHPNATYALLLIMFMAHNLFYAYVFRHLKSYRLYRPTMKRIAEDLMASFLHWKWPMSWIHFDDT